jgi:hypothetical protein
MERDGSEFKVDQEMRETSNRIRCILNLIEWTSVDPSNHQNTTGEISNGHQLETFMAYVRELGAQDSAIPSNNNESEQEDAFVLAARTLKSRPNDRFSETFDHLAILPTRIAETLGRSENIPEVMTILRSIAILVSCCAENFASEETEANFMTMTAWLAKVPDLFHQMVVSNQPAALIVTACWAAILVKRAQYCGCWFLGNSAEMVLSHVNQRVSDNLAIVKLIKDIEIL